MRAIQLIPRRILCIHRKMRPQRGVLPTLDEIAAQFNKSTADFAREVSKVIRDFHVFLSPFCATLPYSITLVQLMRSPDDEKGARKAF